VSHALKKYGYLEYLLAFSACRLSSPPPENIWRVAKSTSASTASARIRSNFSLKRWFKQKRAESDWVVEERMCLSSMRERAKRAPWHEQAKQKERPEHAGSAFRAGPFFGTKLPDSSPRPLARSLVKHLSYVSSSSSIPAKYGSLGSSVGPKETVHAR
jgi:hypothetical protein